MNQCVSSWRTKCPLNQTFYPITSNSNGSDSQFHPKLAASKQVEPKLTEDNERYIPVYINEVTGCKDTTWCLGLIVVPTASDATITDRNSVKILELLKQRVWSDHRQTTVNSTSGCHSHHTVRSRFAWRQHSKLFLFKLTQRSPPGLVQQGWLTCRRTTGDTWNCGCRGRVCVCSPASCTFKSRKRWKTSKTSWFHRRKPARNPHQRVWACSTYITYISLQHAFHCRICTSNLWWWRLFL